MFTSITNTAAAVRFSLFAAETPGYCSKSDSRIIVQLYLHNCWKRSVTSDLVSASPPHHPASSLTPALRCRLVQMCAAAAPLDHNTVLSLSGSTTNGDGSTWTKWTSKLLFLMRKHTILLMLCDLCLCLCPLIKLHLFLFAPLNVSNLSSFIFKFYSTSFQLNLEHVVGFGDAHIWRSAFRIAAMVSDCNFYLKWTCLNQETQQSIWQQRTSVVLHLKYIYVIPVFVFI